ncbi:MAG: hypothetical protein K9J12_05100 [Melioribacteraceae bacterium]|nr:hypothetical protein [Melioribacteraceae bacterium]MCF8262952.1 hypothetical protein [Melioribacteraceae bacterium]MCF8414347.1 hypothetical protein [Melioribacteraceae bacterium]MCF8430615.1 hypothetical protein [Melioribacteraceae bacterium]
MFKKILFCSVFLLSFLAVNGQDRQGVFAGFSMYNVSHTNPYINLGGDVVTPTNFVGYEDKTSHKYFTFGWAAYSEKSWGEFSTNALDLLINPIAFGSENEEGQADATGSSPFFDDYESNVNLFMNSGDQPIFEETDLFRIAGGGRLIDEFPLMLGIQAGLGKFGLNPSENTGVGFVKFNNTVDMYYGVNLGASLEFGPVLAMVNAFYDFHFFIKGGSKDGYDNEGNRLTVEATVFPFEAESDLGRFFIKAFYKQNTVPYLKDWSENYTVEYSNSSVGFSINYFIFSI